MGGVSSVDGPQTDLTLSMILAAALVGGNTRRCGWWLRPPAGGVPGPGWVTQSSEGTGGCRGNK